MIDPKHIKEDIESIRKLLEKRNMTGVVDIERLKTMNDERRSHIQ